MRRLGRLRPLCVQAGFLESRLESVKGSLLVCCEVPGMSQKSLRCRLRKFTHCLSVQ